MKPIIQIIILTIAVVASTVNTNAQTPQEQLQQLVTQLQKTPTDNALREKIVKLAVMMKPSPEIPEDARKPFIKGNTAIKAATGPDDYANAIKLYQEALLLAPWWADAYFNLARGQELHQDYDAAIQSTKFFLMTSPPGTDAREAQDHIYALEELRDKKVASDGKTAEDEQRQKARALEQQQANAFVGTWYQYIDTQVEGRVRLYFTIARDGTTFRFSGSMMPSDRLPFDVVIEGGELVFTINQCIQVAGGCDSYGSARFRGRVGNGGREMSFRFTPLPQSPEQQRVGAKWSTQFGDRKPSNLFGEKIWIKE